MKSKKCFFEIKFFHTFLGPNVKKFSTRILSVLWSSYAYAEHTLMNCMGMLTAHHTSTNCMRMQS